MATPFKPEEAVVLFVEFQGAIHCAHLLSGTYYTIGDPSELEFRQSELTRRRIPWDNFGTAAGNLNGFGVRLDHPEALVDAITARVVATVGHHV